MSRSRYKPTERDLRVAERLRSPRLKFRSPEPEPPPTSQGIGRLWTTVKQQVIIVSDVWVEEGRPLPRKRKPKLPKAFALARLLKAAYKEDRERWRWRYDDWARLEETRE